MQKIKKLFIIIFSLSVFITGLSLVQADEFTKEDLKRWEQEFMTVVQKGDNLFHSGSLGSNTVSCGQCHPNAANTHPETFPKFQKQIGKVVSLAEMINWCLQHPLEGSQGVLGPANGIARHRGPGSAEDHSKPLAPRHPADRRQRVVGPDRAEQPPGHGPVHLEGAGELAGAPRRGGYQVNELPERIVKHLSHMF